KAFLKKVSKKMGLSMRKPTVVVCTPSGSTAVERRAIHNAVSSYGAKQVHLIEEPIAAAIGSDLPVDEPLASVVVDIGGGTSDRKAFLKKVSKKMGLSMRKPTVVVCTPSGSTAVERRAIHNAVSSYGAKQVHLIEEPIAAAIGSDLPVDEPLASVVVDIGGGT